MKTLLICVLLALPALAKEPAPPAATAAAEKFLASLDPTGKTKAAFPFDATERENFHYTPRDRAGLPLKEMSESQRAAAMALLDSALSEKGSLKVSQIMTLEGVLAEIENNPIFRDAGKYTVSIFGKPGDPDGWGWRFEGHHISVNVTLQADKTISVTPSFLGSNPAEVRQGRLKGLRVLAEEEDLARVLVTTLVAAGKAETIFSDKPPGEIITGEKRTATALDPVGIPASDMTPAQQEALRHLISTYTGRCRSNIATADMAKIEKAGFGKIRFGWAGGAKRGEAYYYRIQGPTFLMESANVQNQANHIHAVWRDFQNDFGRDLLREHVGADHANP